MSEIADVLAIAANNSPGWFYLTEETQAILFYALGKAEEYKLWSSYPGEYIDQDEREQIDDAVENATYEVMNSMENPFPAHFTLNVLTALMITGTTLGKNILSTTLTNHFVEVTPIAQFNAMGFQVSLQSGRYYTTIIGTVAPNQGRAHAYIDGQPATGIFDMYQSGLLLNQERTAYIDVLEDGYHTMTFQVDDKNASSSAYGFRPYLIHGIRVSDVP